MDSAAKRNGAEASPEDEMEEFVTPVDPDIGININTAHASSGEGNGSANTPRELFGNGVRQLLQSPGVRKRSLLSSPRGIQMSATFATNEARFEDGYDSDGQLGPFMDAVSDEVEADEEEVGVAADLGEENPTNASPVHLTEDQINKMKVAELRDELKIRRKLSRGTKMQLRELLKAAVLAEAPVFPGLLHSKEKELKGFPPGSHWVELLPSNETVDCPVNPGFKNPRAPTDDSNYETAFIKKKFDQKFDVPVFAGTAERKKIRRNGLPGMEKVVRIKGEPTPIVTLTHDSHPAEFVELFMPYDINENDNDRKKYPSFELFKQWTNSKAIMAGAGDGTYYPEFKPFTVKEIRQHIGLYLLQGISPSPRIEMNFQSQLKDSVAGNDLVNQAFGPNAERRHKHFKAFLATQNPVLPVPSRKEKPNWKVQPLIDWLNLIAPRLWACGVDISADEQTIGFKGKHVDKKRISYKRAGDGFQTEAICDDGYTYQVYFRNDAPPREYVNLGLSPMHARVVAMFEKLRDDYHRCSMDNLYNSARFCHFALVNCRVLTAGVARTEGRGVPKVVIQEAVKTEKEAARIRGFVKAAKLEGDSECSCLIAASVYDTKPVHFLTTCAEEIRWVEKQRPVYNVDSGTVEKMKFLRLNINDHYNNKMNSVDRADQLREVYKFDRWLRQRKWWWSIFLWFLGVSTVNAFEIYKAKCRLANKKAMSHYEFQRAVALAWIAPELHGPTPVTPEHEDFRIVTRAASASSSSSKKRKFSEYVTLNLFDKVGHSRLDRTRQHWPCKQQKRNMCKLHRLWGITTFESVFECTVCDVKLCIDCWEPYHSCASKNELETTLSQRFGPRHSTPNQQPKKKHKSISDSERERLNNLQAPK